MKPILCYCCEVWSVLGSKHALEDLERVEIGFLKVLLGVQVHTKTLHVHAEFGRYPLHMSWQSQAAKYLQRLESMSLDRVLKQAFLADCRLPHTKSWQARLVDQLSNFLVATPSDDNPHLKIFSLGEAQSAYEAELDSESSSRSTTYRGIKYGYTCKACIQQCNNRHLRRILAQFRTSSHWLSVETGRHNKTDRKDRTCPMCSYRVTNPGIPAQYFDSFDSDEEGPDPIEDEHHMIFECSAYASARIQFQDLFGSDISDVGQFLNQADCNRVAKFLSWARMMRMNRA